MRLKAFCSSHDLDKMETDIKLKGTLVQQYYEPIRRKQTTTSVIVKRMDACIILTTEICELINKRQENI